MVKYLGTLKLYSAGASEKGFLRTSSGSSFTSQSPMTRLRRLRSSVHVLHCSSLDFISDIMSLQPARKASFQSWRTEPKTGSSVTVLLHVHVAPGDVNVGKP